ncbi:hypothetical protein SESBI_00280 [Sesbania bispinosa]|nr:hypothetical protein SESBI_00280 [Sesbania bispinosa]
MERWSGVLRVPLHPNSRTFHRVGASLCLSPESRTLSVPIANAIFFCGDRVEGTGNPVIERLSDLQKLSEIVVSKFGSFINAWVIEASVFNGPFAVYKDFIPSVNQYGEPRSYHPIGFPASTSTVSLLSNCLEEVKRVILGRQVDTKSSCTPSCCFSQPKTFILGFSKGGTVLNQIVTELAFSDFGSNVNSSDVGQPMGRKFNESEEIYIVPKTKEGLLNSISEIHYVDVGLNSTEAYLTNHDVFERISKRLIQGAPQLRFILHGTPRQWSDKRRDWIRNEKDKMLHLLESEAHKRLSTSQVLGLVMNTLYKQFVQKDIKDFDAFNVAIYDTFNTINMALPGKHYDTPSHEDVKDFFNQWKEANNVEAKKKMFIDFMNKSVNLNKVDESTIITAIVAPPAAMVAKRTGQTVPQLKLMNAIPDVVFVPSATVLALIVVKILRLMFMGTTTSKGETGSHVEHSSRMGDESQPQRTLWSAAERKCLHLLQGKKKSFTTLLQIHAFILQNSLHNNLNLLTKFITTCASLASSASRKNDAITIVQHARRFFDHHSATHNRDEFLCNSMINTHFVIRQFTEPFTLYRDLCRETKTAFKPSGYTFTALAKGCAACMATREGLQVHGVVVKNGFCLDLYVATALVDMYVKFGVLGSARRLFDEMSERNRVSWTAVIVGYARCGDMSEARKLFYVMPDKDVAAFNVIIDGYVKLGCMGLAQDLFDKMRDKNVISWTNVSRAERVLKEAVKMEEECVGDYVMLRNLYAAEQRWTDVEDVKQMIKKRGSSKEVACSVIEVDGSFREFVASDHLHSHLEVIQLTLGQLWKHMRVEIIY